MTEEPTAEPTPAPETPAAPGAQLIPRDNFGQRARDIVLAPVEGAHEPTWNLLAHAATLAGMIAHTRFVPAGFRGKPDSITAAMLLGHELGVGPMTALRQLYVTDVRIDERTGKEKGGEILLAAQLMRAIARRAGHRLWPQEYSSTRVTWTGHSRGEEDRTISVTWTIEDAKRAKLVRQYSAWETFPRAMLSARASAELCRLIAEDVLAGVYAVEEMQDDPEVIAGVQQERLAAPENGTEPAPDAPETPTRRRSTRKATVVATSQPVSPDAPSGDQGAAPAVQADPAPLEVPGDNPDAAPAEEQPRAAAPAQPETPELEVPGDAGDPLPLQPPAEPEPAPPTASTATVAQPMPVAQRIAMLAREAGVDRKTVCRIVSGNRVESAKDLDDAEAAAAIEHLRAVIRGDERLGFASVDGQPQPAFVPLTDAELNDLAKTELAKLSGIQGALRSVVAQAGWTTDAGPLLEWVATLSRERRVELVRLARTAQKPASQQETQE